MVCGCFPAIKTDLKHCDRDHIACKSWRNWQSHSLQSLLTPALGSHSNIWETKRWGDTKGFRRSVVPFVHQSCIYIHFYGAGHDFLKLLTLKFPHSTFTTVMLGWWPSVKAFIFVYKKDNGFYLNKELVASFLLLFPLETFKMSIRDM